MRESGLHHLRGVIRPVRPARVLVVEDDADIAALIKHALEREGAVGVEVVATGAAAFEALDSLAPDLVILDLNLPDPPDGFRVCHQIRERPDGAAVPIIVVTARTSEADRVRALDLGADDYLTKPFGLNELAARVRAVMRRRASASAPASRYTGRRLVVDFPAVSVRVDGHEVRLTRREFELLGYLFESRGRVLTRDHLLERLWSRGRDVGARTIDVHVGRLRAKLGPAGGQIETVFGIGYGRLPRQAADVWCVADDLKPRRQFVEKQIWCSGAVSAPPVIDVADLRVRFRSGSDRQAHRRWRSSSRIADAGRR